MQKSVLRIHASEQWIRILLCSLIDLQDANKKLICLFKSFFAYYFLKMQLHHFQRYKVKKTSQSSSFCYYFCLVIEGSGSIPLTNGSGSRRPKNMWIRWIRIRNTGKNIVYFREKDCFQKMGGKLWAFDDIILPTF